MVEIARALASDAKIIIFDEPTSSLTDKEKEVLFRNIETMKNNGAGIIYITHKMDEVFEISDRIAVFRDGAEAGSLITDRSTIDDVTQLMIGRKLDEFFHKSNASIGNESVLTVEGLTIHGIFEDVSFSVNKGEVLGLYGLVGAGRSEIVESIFGLRRLDKGKIFVNGKQAKINSSVDALKYKMGLVPEDRKEQGLILSMSCTQNIGIPQLRNFTKHFFIQSNLENQLFRQYRDKLSIQTPDGNQKCVYLSGGNQQKIVIAKWMAMCPDLLILDEPTRGIDIGSKAEIHRLIAEMAEEGLAILVISSEMPEVIGISNRVLAVSNGRIHASFTGEEITETNLIKALTGASAQRN
jgi:ribose transport system ATP-binding protein